MQQLLGGLDPLERVGQQLGAGVVHDRRERIALGGWVGERLAHRHRPVYELGGGRDHSCGDTIARELVQCQRRLQRRHAAADDHHAKLGLRVCGGHE